MRIADAIETDDETVDVFFHDVDFGEFLGKELFKLFFILKGKRFIGADSNVRFDEDGPTDLGDEILGFLEIGRAFKQDVAHCFGAAFLKAIFHG